MRKAVRRKKLQALLFCLPALVILAVVIGVPSLATLVMSLYDWDGISQGRFIGLENFREIFTEDHVFPTAVLNNLTWAGLFLTIPIILGLTVAFTLAALKRGRLFFMTVFFIPVILSRVVVGRLWGWLMNPFFGINQILSELNLDFLAQSWLGNPDIALYSVAFVDNWTWWGFIMVIFLAAYQQIDPSYYEAADVDGANPLQKFIHISIPLVRPTLFFILLLTAVWSFKAFDFVYLMTQGGPGHATELLSTWIYKKGILDFRAGYGSALAVILMLFSGVLIGGFYIIRRD